MEKNYEAKFDEYADVVKAAYAKRTGVDEQEPIVWSKVLEVVLNVYLVLTILSSLMRPDFMSLTCIALGLLSINDPVRFGRRTFRLVVAMLITSFFYDFLWLIWLRSSEAEDF